MSKTTKKNKQGGFSVLNRILIIQLIVIFGLSIFITKAVSDRTRQNTIEHLGAITDERAEIIQNYVKNSENTLRAFTKAKQVTDLLEYSKTVDMAEFVNPDNPNPDPQVKAAQEAAQKYTEEFGKDIDNLEGLWIGSWETFVLTHSSAPVAPQLIGMQTRKDPIKQAELHDGMRAGKDGLYDTGFIISPASGKQCISMYMAVYDENRNPIGFCGLGIFTSGVIDTLNSIPIRGVEHSTYAMVDASTGNYIFGASEDLIGTQIESKEVMNICQKYNHTDTEVTDNFTYRKNGKEYISIYTYIPGYNWVLLIDDDTNEAFSLTRTMIIYLGIFGLVIISLIVVFNIIAKRQEKVNQKLYSTIAKNNMTKKSLNTAMFNDVLTGVNNRISFSINIEKNSRGTDFRYFIMFNILGFSDINTTYGNDAGDNVLVHTVNVLREFFPDQEIYRTGSDEFIVVVPAEKEFEDPAKVLEKVNIAYRVLAVPFDLEGVGKIYNKFKIAAVKKGKNADSSIIAVLKDMTNKTGEAVYGNIDYLELN